MSIFFYLQDSEEVCAQKVILAVPPSALRHIEWSPHDESLTFRESLDAVATFPVLRVYFIYSRAWWSSDGDDDVTSDPPHTDIYTDLPIRHVTYLGRYNNNSRHKHYVFMTAEAQGDDMASLRSLLHLRQFDGEKVSYCNDTRYLIREISQQMAEIYRQNVDTFPAPTHVIIRDSTEHKDGGSWYVWKRGALWDTVSARVLQPVPTEDVYIVGSGFCGGLCQLSAEGAIQTVDELIGKYLLPDDDE